jgi:hypothetical protein
MMKKWTKSRHNILHISMLLMLCCTGIRLYADEKAIPAEFSILDSKNAPLFFKPMITTVHESFNSNLFSTANYANEWTFAIDLSVTGVLIPESQKTYQAILPDGYGNNPTRFQTITGNGERNPSTVTQPTIYGGSATPVFVIGQGEQGYPLSFPEGKNAGAMVGLPVFQFALGIPSRTQIRFIGAPISTSDFSLTYLRVGVNQRVDHFFDLFEDDPTVALAVHGAVNLVDFNYGDSIMANMTSMVFGVHGSKTFLENYTVYGGLQWEGLSGSFHGARTKPQGTIKSPYEEIVQNKHMKFDLASDNSFRILVGAAARFGFFEIHADAGYAAQPVFNAGFTFHLASPTKVAPSPASR